MTESSEHLFEQAQDSLAGGISHESRVAAPFPKYIDRAKGSRKWEVDGREYVDYAMGSASLLLGHANPDVVAALQEHPCFADVEKGSISTAVADRKDYKLVVKVRCTEIPSKTGKEK